MGQNTLSVAALLFVLASKLSEAVVIEAAGIFIALMSVLVFTAMITVVAAVFNVVLATVTVARVAIVVAVTVATSVIPTVVALTASVVAVAALAARLLRLHWQQLHDAVLNSLKPRLIGLY